VLLALGSALGGWSLHVLDGKVRYVHNLYGKERHVVAAPEPLGPGDHRVEYVFSKDEGLGGVGVLCCDDLEVARGVIHRFTPSGFNAVGAGLTCGYEWGPAVGTGYRGPVHVRGQDPAGGGGDPRPGRPRPAGRTRGDPRRAMMPDPSEGQRRQSGIEHKGRQSGVEQKVQSSNAIAVIGLG
jgi:hypothetical protein